MASGSAVERTILYPRGSCARDRTIRTMAQMPGIIGSTAVYRPGK
jgi:hypothetical protein